MRRKRILPYIGFLHRRDLKRYIIENPNHITPDQIMKISNDILSDDNTVISDEYYDFLRWLRHLPGRQEVFSKYIKRRYKSFRGKKVLEVGCGRTARLSSLLSRHFKMTAIDPQVESDNAPKRVQIIQDFFTEDTDISEYDLVIALEPCDATEHIIRACLKAHKPFIVVLCGIAHQRIDGVMPSDVSEWYNYLISIDPLHLAFGRLSISGFDPYFISSNY